mmetsp:Transcript_12766/g.19286  ORF Transcript_12766/g.19286 Transcript_12766/m.19286 type:complete len:232 (+) Transcript_12766:2370-3065(+)
MRFVSELIAKSSRIDSSPKATTDLDSSTNVILSSNFFSPEYNSALLSPRAGFSKLSFASSSPVSLTKALPKLDSNAGSTLLFTTSGISINAAKPSSELSSTAGMIFSKLEVSFASCVESRASGELGWTSGLISKIVISSCKASTPLSSETSRSELDNESCTASRESSELDCSSVMISERAVTSFEISFELASIGRISSPVFSSSKHAFEFCVTSNVLSEVSATTSRLISSS